MTADDHHHDVDKVEPKGIRRRSFLRNGLLLAGGAAAGVAGAALYDAAIEPPDEVITADGVVLRNAGLERDIELTNSTNRGRGTQRMIWSVPTTEKVMTLTFDDGPDPAFTPMVLDILERFGVTATFDIMGWNAEHHDGLLDRVTAASHEIGNHTLTHKDLAFQTVVGTQRQLADAKQVIDELTGQDTKLFRPPRGVLTGDAADISARLGYDVLLWTAIITRPPGTRPDVIRDYARSKFGPGHILAMHDGIGAGTFDRKAAFARELIEKRRDEIKALPAIVESALEDGYRFVTITEMFQLAGIAPPGAHVGSDKAP